jgi:hypothetical protein
MRRQRGSNLSNFICDVMCMDIREERIMGRDS